MIRPSVSLSALAGLISFPAFAQSTAVTTNRIPEVVVTATRTEEAVAKTAASVSIVTRTEIEQQKFTTVAEALQSVPGLVVARNGAPGQVTAIFLRGTESNHTLLTIDGRRAPSLLAGGYDWGNLGLENIERIEVVKSSSSALYGGDAIGGVVNLITKTGRGLAKPEHEVSFEGGSFNTFREAVASRGAIGKFDYAVSASQFNAEYPRSNNDYRNSSFRSSFGYEATEDLYFDAKVSYLQSKGGSPGAIPGNLSDYLKRETFNISPGVDWKISERWQTKLFYTFENQFQPSFDGGPLFGSQNRLNVVAHLVEWQNHITLHDAWKITLGTMWQDQAVDRTTTSLFGGTINANLQTAAGYAQSQWSPVEALAIINSVRYDAYSDYQSAVTWRQGISYTVPKVRTVVFGNIARSVAPPTPQDLYFFGNPTLKAERATSWELGVEQPFWEDRITATATWFQHKYKDFIQLDAFSTPQNISRATSEGVEFGLRLKPCEEFSLNASYTYLTAEDDTRNTRLLRRPRHQVSLEAMGKPVKDLTLAAGASWIVERQDALFPSQVAIGDYLLVRASAGYQVGKNLQLWVRGDNLLDQKYDALRGYPALRLGAYAGLKVTF